jgi:hypothetical protein
MLKTDLHLAFRTEGPKGGRNPPKMNHQRLGRPESQWAALATKNVPSYYLPIDQYWAARSQKRLAAMESSVLEVEERRWTDRLVHVLDWSVQYHR